MVRTFNLGIGLTLVVRPEMVDLVCETLPEARRVGTVTRGEPDSPRVSFA